MKFSLIICTYQRPNSVRTLLDSVNQQNKYPDEILIVDGSRDEETRKVILKSLYNNLKYFKVDEKNRGLTNQRNFGLEKVSKESEIICFLDDDTVLYSDFFSEILRTYEIQPEVVGVSGYITNEVDWKKISSDQFPDKSLFSYDGWVRTEGSRFKLRSKFGLSPDAPPGIMPSFSHGYSSGFLPPSGKIYEVEMLMGGIASYKKGIFREIRFSPYFEGYGLYEDADFSIRASRLGKLIVNTAAKVEHHHAQEGRPDKFKYGKMVIRNGWYVWRIKFPKPSLKAKLKWHGTALLLTLIRLGNIFTTSEKKEALSESLGRFAGWWSLLFKKPKHEV